MTTPLHPWALVPAEAIQLQAQLRQQLALQFDGRPVHTVAGFDMSLTGGNAHAAIVVFSYPDLKPIEGVTADVPLTFPYVPGLLAFREGPAVLAAWEKLLHEPDLLMFDGQGIAHPRGLGIAAHMGLWLQRPTIGVAKTRLYGHHDEPAQPRNSWAPLRDEREPERVIGAALRLREGGRPLYISPGHLMDVDSAVSFVIACGMGYRLPETTRWAHKFAAGETLPA
jgi:deoxyribonuclease V